MSDKKEKNHKLLCEKVLNQSLSAVGKYISEIEAALEQDVLSDRDLILIKIAARAFVQQANKDKADSLFMFEVDLYQEKSPCGHHPKSDCPCERDPCLMLDS